jgi:hypothetical protein
MSRKLSSISNRLAKLEQKWADRARGEDLVNCICRKVTVFYSHKPEEFEAEKNKPCPAHGVRQMGQLVQIEYIGRPAARQQLHEALLAGDPRVGRISPPRPPRQVLPRG